MNIQNIAVLVSAGRHPTSGTARYCHNDSLALTLALQLAQTVSAKTHVIHAGNPDEPALTDYLALGAAHIQVVPIRDERNMVDSLAVALTKTDMIVTGSRAENGADSGLLPYLLAAALNRPVIANVLSIQPTQSGVEVLQFLPKGKRRLVLVNLPAIIAVHPLAAVEPRYAYARQVQGKITASSVRQPEARHTVAANNITWQLRPATGKPHKLKAYEKKTGHARLLSAIVSEGKGGAVVIDGNPVEKAQVILDYLREHRLINF